MNKSKAVALSTLFTTLAFLLGSPAAAAANSSLQGTGPAYAPCGRAGSHIDTNPWVKTGSGANIRTGSSTSCALAGTVTSDWILDYYCYTLGDDGYTWTYLYVVSTGARGWVRDNLLTDNGSQHYCGW